MNSRILFPLFRFLRFLQYVLVIVGALAALFVIGVLVIRFVLLPQWEAQPAKAAAFLGERIGLPVTLGSLKAGWEGWNPQLTVHDLQVYAPGNTDTTTADAQLALPAVMLQADAWNSLLHLDLRFRHLHIEQPTLIVRRDATGNIFIGGVLLSPSPQEEAAGSGKFVDWLLRQRVIEISGGTVEWLDEKRDALPLIVEQLDFRGEWGLSHYRFGLRGDLVSATGATFEVRGDAATGLLQRSFDRDWQWYVRLNRLDFSDLQQWVDLPVALTRGEGSAQAWVTTAKQRVTAATVDMALQNVKVNLAPAAEPAVAPLELQEVHGRFSGRDERHRVIFSAENLAFVEKNGLRLEPMTATLTLEGFDPATPVQVTALLTQAPRGRIEFSRIDASALTGLLSFVPLPDGWRETLSALNIHGTLENGSGSWELAHEKNAAEDALRFAHYNAHAAMRGASAQAYGAYPGARGISGTVSLDETQGSIALDSRNVTLDLPQEFSETLPLERLNGNVRWAYKPEGVLVQVEALHFANADVEGTVGGTWRANGSAGVADLTAQLQRATVASAYRYIPNVAGEDVRQWLRESLKSGTVDQARMVLKGDLSRFPFRLSPNGKQDDFAVDAHVAGVRMVYDPEWPAIADLDAALHFKNEKLTIVAKRGTIFDAALGQTRAVIPDLEAEHPHLQIDGSASGPMATYLRFLDESPVGGWLDHMLAGTQATGEAALTLKLGIPLSGPETSKVSGALKFSGNTLNIPELPALTRAQGEVSFTENDVKADALKFEALGGAGTVKLASRSNGIALTGQGTADLSTLRARYTLPLLDRLSGMTTWQLTLNTGGNRAHWVLLSPLTGAAIELPEPLGKTANASAPLRIAHDTLTTAGSKEERWRIDYASPTEPLAVIAKRVPDGADWRLERALLYVGETKSSVDVALPSAPGLSVRGALARFDIDPWYALPQTSPDNKKADTAMFGNMDINIGALKISGRQLHDVHLSTHKAADVLHIGLVSREAEGKMTWERAGANGAVNGRLKGDFVRLTLPAAGESLSPNAVPAKAVTGAAGNEEQKTHTVLTPGSANPWPAIDFKADHFFRKETDLGQLSIRAEPRGTDWRIHDMALTNPDGAITANGWWRTARQMQRTEITIETRVNDAEKFLARFGVPESVAAADVQLDGALSWANAPSDFDSGTLAGHLTLNVGKGHFAKLEPGIGRLLGVLSLQALPRRMTLDFRDVFSEGFAFDSITGTTEINNGVLRTSDLLMNGAAAKVKLTGTVDLSKETQNLDVYIQPSLTDSLSVGAAGASALLLANPVGAAAVGIGALIGQMLLGNPVEKIFSHEYIIKGSWSDPIVEKKTREEPQNPLIDGNAATAGEAERKE